MSNNENLENTETESSTESGSAESLSARVLGYRARNDLSQQDVARLAQVSQPTISNIEKKGHVPKRETLEKLEALLSGIAPVEQE